MYRFASKAGLGALVALALAFGTAAAQDASVVAGSGSDVVGHVYVNNNTAGKNTISGFDRHVDGSLTPMDASPFATGGAGSGMPIATQGAIQFSADRRYVLAVNPGSNELSSLKVHHDGSLQGVDTIDSGGNAPASIAVLPFRMNLAVPAIAANRGSLVYIANTGAGGVNYTGFRMNPGGHLSAIDDSTFALPDNAFPGQILFSKDGLHAAGMRTGGTATDPDIGPSQIDSFIVGSDGLLDAAPGSPFASQRIGPIGAEYSLIDPTQLFVTNAHDGPGLGSVSAYQSAEDGSLSPVGDSPFENGQTATCWVEINAGGDTMFVVNTATPSLSSYAIAEDGTLSLIGSTPFKDAMAPFDARLDPAGEYLYVVDNGAPLIHVFAVDGDTLTELGGSPFANTVTGAAFGIIVD
jgi:6-phosphogluconolactonase